MRRRTTPVKYLKGIDLNSFIITVKTDNAGVSSNNQFTIPVNSSFTYNYKIETSDGQIIENNTGDTTITFPNVGTYDIYITGTFPQIFFNNESDKFKLIEIKQWGIIFDAVNDSFKDCEFLERVSAEDTLRVSSLGSWDSLFQGCIRLEEINNTQNWEWEKANNLAYTFQKVGRQTTGLSINLTGVNFSNVTTLSNFSANSKITNLIGFGNLDTSNVTSFNSALGFNNLIETDISNLDVSSATSLVRMLRNSDNIDSDLSSWDIRNVTSFVEFMLNNSGFSTVNYDATLIGWEATLQAVYPNGVGYPHIINIDFGGSMYSSAGAVARQSLIDNFGWTITDGGGVFEITVKSDNTGTSASNQFTIPTFSAAFTYLYDVETSDGYVARGLSTDHTITFPSGAGTHTVFISGIFPYARFINGTNDKLKLLSIENFGVNYGGTFQISAFDGCANLVINATDIGDFGLVPNFDGVFRNTSISSIPLINTSSSTRFGSTFVGTDLVTLPLLDVSNGVEFQQFLDASSLFTTLPALDFSSGTNFIAAFRNTNLTNVDSNIFIGCLGTNFNQAFIGTNLTQTAIDTILVNIESNNTSNGVFSQTGGSAPSAIGEAAIDALRVRGWVVTVTGGY